MNEVQDKRLERALLGLESIMQGMPESEMLSVLAISFAVQYRGIPRADLEERLDILKNQTLISYDSRQATT